MICGCGIDLCAVSRFEDEATRTRIVRRFFSPNEQAYCAGRGAQTAAGIFAAKEALFKALGTGIACSLAEVEVLHAENGAPTLALHGEAQALAQARGVLRAHVSITHEAGMAAAVVILEGERHA